MFQYIRQTQEVFSGPSSVTGRHRRPSQDLPVYQADTGGLLCTLGVLKVCRAWESSERGPPWAGGCEVSSGTCRMRRGSQGRRVRREEISAKEIVWVKTSAGKADTDFER